MSAAPTQTRSRRRRGPAPGWWLLARGLHAPTALLAAAVVVAAFSLIPAGDVPVGIITADTPAVMPLYLLEPPLLSMLLIRPCFSAAAILEATSARRTLLWRAGLIALLVCASAGLLLVQPNIPDDVTARVLVSYLGCVGLTLAGAAAVGPVGWLLPAAYVMFLAVFGATGFGEVAPWAWSMQPVHRAAPIALVLLVVGCAGLGWRWSRTSNNELAGE